MTILSISAAAQTAGIDRRTLQRAIQSGRISATVDATGRRGVDVAELLRVYGPLPAMPQPSTQGQRAALPQITAAAGATDALVDVLREQVRQMQEQLRLAQEREVRLLTMLEHEQTTRANLETRLLTGPGKKKKGD